MLRRPPAHPTSPRRALSRPKPVRATRRPGPTRPPGPGPVLPGPAERRAGLAAAMQVAPEAIAPETLERLDVFLDRLATWTRKINLIGPSTLADAWSRHILDSARLWPHGPHAGGRLVDLGSGAGLPGLILAILGAPDVHLIESDQRKAVFLRDAARLTATPVTVHATRIETLSPLGADIVTARALAPLPDLLPLVVRHLRPGGLALLPKGREAAGELTACADQWIMRVHTEPGAIADRPADDRDPPGPLLILREIRRAPSPP